MSKLTKTKDNMKKYKIAEYLASFSREVQGKKITELAGILQTSEKSVRRHMYLTLEDSASINTDQLLHYANYFSVSLDDMINQPIRTVTPS